MPEAANAQKGLCRAYSFINANTITGHTGIKLCRLNRSGDQYIIIIGVYYSNTNHTFLITSNNGNINIIKLSSGSFLLKFVELNNALYIKKNSPSDGIVSISGISILGATSYDMFLSSVTEDLSGGAEKSFSQVSFS